MDDAPRMSWILQAHAHANTRTHYTHSLEQLTRLYTYEFSLVFVQNRIVLRVVQHFSCGTENLGSPSACETTIACRYSALFQYATMSTIYRNMTAYVNSGVPQINTNPRSHVRFGGRPISARFYLDPYSQYYNRRRHKQLCCPARVCVCINYIFHDHRFDLRRQTSFSARANTAATLISMLRYAREISLFTLPMMMMRII